VQIIPAGRSQQVKIPTEVTRSGQFQVTATLVGPDGLTWGDPVQLSVQSSAYGALTVILMAVAGGVLVVMVALRIRQRLRGRRARIAAAAQGTAGPAGPGSADAGGDGHQDQPGDRRGDRPQERHSDRLVAESVPSPGPSPVPTPGPTPTPPAKATHQRSDQRQDFRS
jgi:protein involved in polysaccharide export with SLBB domain